ncbi:RNA-binding KH domain-containing protein [Actinidia rufa]|uniref:RNA-binding KH domain-containing protein n=1 Tax=Actinidia rufa TaxID=165716 RepID=A0A7J0G5P7_9ERIC|nr:RNA-binding KH domain-containing protein [Actinidia rufa]
MGETGKRFRSHRNNDSSSNNQKRRAYDRDEKGNDELVVYRILCPDGFIGSVIGKSGKVINSIRQDTKAKRKDEVEVDEEFDDREPLCPAQDALLKVHDAIANAVASVRDSDKRQEDKEECQILVPSSQSANIIGKSGVTIKKLRSQTRANIRVTAKDAGNPTHSCAMESDNFVSITGDPEAVREALFAVSAIMYKFTPKEDIPLDTNVPEVPPSIIIPSDVPIYPSGGFYPSVDPIVHSRSFPPMLGATPVTELPGYADKGSTWPVYSSSLPVVSGYDWSCYWEGRGSIKSVRQASGARVEVDDATADRDECIITITSTESPDDLKSMAVEAVLLLQGKISDEDDDTVTIRLLVPSKVIGCIIGKSGSIINEIRKRTKADVRISKGKKPKCADADDEHVEVVGEVGNVRDALVQIVLRLRDDVLKDREGGRNASTGADTLYSGGAGLSMPAALPTIPPVAPLGYEQRVETGSGFGMLSSSGLYGYGSLPMGDDGYGSLSSYSSKLYGGLPPPSTLEMIVPAHAVGKVMGKGGANIANIRKISGASVEISDSKSSRGDRVWL